MLIATPQRPPRRGPFSRASLPVRLPARRHLHPPVTPGFLLLLDRRLRYRALLLFPRAEPALLDLVLERLGVDLKEAGRLRAVPVHAVEDLVDGHAFGIPGGPTRDVLETDHLVGVDGRRHRRGGHGWPRAAAEAGGDLLVNGQGGAEHDDAPRGVLQLTDVAWPVILEELTRRR